MKKTLIAAAVMAASGVAFAASNVTLYGVIDAGADRKSTRLNSSHPPESRMPSSA